MSYCRFENTARDLADCVSAVNRGEINELNEYEVQGLIKIKFLIKIETIKELMFQLVVKAVDK